MSLYLVDSHCHLDQLNLKAYDNELGNAMEHARELGVGHMLCVAVNMKAYPKMRAQVEAMAEAGFGVSATAGVHPNETKGHDPEVEELVEMAADPRVVAIGETGLDYYRSEGDLEWQRDRLRRHIAAAKCSGLPLVVHIREAFDDTIRILEEEGAGEVGGVVHCFSGDWEQAKRSIDLNFHISFSGIVTFNNAETLREVAAKCPAERILVETDAPYLTPVPHRGKPNVPGFTRHVAECVAEQRGLAWEAVAERTTENFFGLFRKAVAV
ncbi:TatD family hydrolase [Endothiovibrio diazotrophicus]